MLPLTLRGRALSALVFSAPPAGDLEALAARGAAALELAERYTDVLAGARRHRECSAAAELQQDLLPPRIAHLEGAEVAGSILPAYDVGGDWIDHCAMADGGWLGVADAVGKGPQASAIGAIALGAYRAARRGGGDLATAAAHIHEAICALEVQEIFMSAVLAAWDAPVVVAVVAALRASAAAGLARRARAARAATAATVRSSGSTGWTRRASPRGDDRRRRARRPRLRRRARAHRARRRAPSARTACAARWRRWRRRRPPRRRPRCSRPSRRIHDGPLRDDASVLVLAPRSSRRRTCRGPPRRSGRRGPRPPRLPRPRPRRAAGARRVRAPAGREPLALATADTEAHVVVVGLGRGRCSAGWPPSRIRAASRAGRAGTSSWPTRRPGRCRC